MGNFFSIAHIGDGLDLSDDSEYEILFSEDDIEEMVSDVANKINHDYANSNGLVLVCVLKGAVPFMADLSRQIIVPHEHRYITAKSYLGTESTGDIKIISNEPLNIDGKDVIIIDDIADSGLTLQTLVKKMFAEENPLSVQCCVLLNKECKRKHNVAIKYSAATIDDHFVIGYGLDLDEKYRHLPYIAIYNNEC
jgi:hypoxanthine phosphoribosyltransferase